MAKASRRSTGPILPMASTFQRSISPSGRFGNSSSVLDSSSFSSSPSSFASSTSSSFCSSPSSCFPHRSASPTRVNLHRLAPLSLSQSVRFSIDKPTSPGRSAAMSARDQVVRRQNSIPLPSIPHKKTCLCSPTTHPGSFRCSLHKNMNHSNSSSSISYSPSRLNARRSAMMNSLVRIATVEGDLVKRALAALIRPSSHHLRRRAEFQPKPSRLSVMSKVGDL